MQTKKEETQEKARRNFLIGARVREVRKSNNVRMTLAEFSQRLGVSGATISAIEVGNNNLTEVMKKAICREFGVNSHWLETGEGAPFTPLDDMMELSQKYSLTPLESSTLRDLLTFSRKDRAILFARLQFEMILAKRSRGK